MPPRSQKPPRASKRQEPQPKPPPTMVYCYLCKAEIDYARQNPGLFFQHLIVDHFCGFNHLCMLSLSLSQNNPEDGETDNSESDPEVVEDIVDPVQVPKDPVVPVPVKDKVVPVNSEFLEF